MTHPGLLTVALSGANPDRVDQAVLRRTGDWTAIAEEVAPDGHRAPWPVDGVGFVGRSGLPEPLRDLPGGPHWLFVRGAVPQGPAVAIVGSRRASRYGSAVARRLGAMLAGGGWVVVSGMALGIDGEAHRGALDAGGATAAVLGSGIDVWYPQRHRTLGEAILEAGGAVVSEFPPGTPPAPWRFPCRNRIIAGWASVVVVVEAAERSGALITARLAAEWGRDVLALPGDIHRPTSVGANGLIRDGAHPFTSVEEAVEMVERVTGPVRPRVPPTVEEDDPLLAVLGTIPIPVEEVVALAGLPAPEVLRALTRLEMSGRVLRADGGVSRVVPPG